jgi:hypothetical protein
MDANDQEVKKLHLDLMVQRLIFESQSENS